VTITIRPQPGTHGDVYQLQWNNVTYDAETETWEPITEPTETTLTARLRAGLQGIFTWTRPIVQYAMPAFDVDRDQINVFEINDTYLFKQYFDNDDVFETLRDYYNPDAYRFEVPTDNDLETVEDMLHEHFYQINVVEDIEPYCVVKGRHSDNEDVLRNTVVKYDRGQETIFLLKDQLSVDQAVEQGATQIVDADTSLPREFR
jgi:hypothetical protein